MPSFDTTCAISGLPISAQDSTACYALLLDSTGPYEEVRPPFEFYQPVGLPIKGNYDDAGRMSVVPDDPGKRLAEAYFGIPIAAILECANFQPTFGIDYSESGCLMRALGHPHSQLTIPNLLDMGFTVDVSDTQQPPKVSHPTLDEYVPHGPKFELHVTRGGIYYIQEANTEDTNYADFRAFCARVSHLLISATASPPIFGISLDGHSQHKASLLNTSHLMYVRADIFVKTRFYHDRSTGVLTYPLGK
jgi:hypothetical protein